MDLRIEQIDTSQQDYMQIANKNKKCCPTLSVIKKKAIENINVICRYRYGYRYRYRYRANERIKMIKTDKSKLWQECELTITLICYW